MAPATASNAPAYEKNEKALCFHHELLYEAKILEDPQREDEKDKTSPWRYRVHYKGWKNTWDDWVPQDRLRKLTEDNRELAASLRRDVMQAESKQRNPKSTSSKKGRTQGSEIDSGRGSEERHSSVPAGGRGTKRGKDNEIEKEEAFYARPSVHFTVPDMIKGYLVDDWENVTKSLTLVELPSRAPVNWVLDTYFHEEKGKRRLGSADADRLVEIIEGMKLYFEKMLGKTLLYKFERGQYAEVRKLWEAGKNEWEGKGPGDCYGVEHLCRLIVNMPEWIAQTNMDPPSVAKVKEEMTLLNQWICRNHQRLFINRYERPSTDYIEHARD